MSLGIDVWMVVENGFQVPETSLINVASKYSYAYNEMEKDVNLSGLSDIEFVKLM